MITIKFKPEDKRRLEKFLKESPKKIYKSLRFSLNDIGDRIEGQAKKNTDEAHFGLFQEGHLRRSINKRPVEGLSVTVGTNLVYARIHDQGGVIKPVKAKYLTIPLGNMKRAKKGAGLFFIKSKKGNKLLVRKKGKGIEPMFLLKDQVTIPKRPYLTNAFKDVVNKQAEGIIRDDILFTLNKALK